MTKTNHLAGESSPYLLQHEHNPVDWYPWGEEALAKARHENKPILLSIGYAACHWCHVMAHESFEDEATAEIMNRLFVNIKVDREERPDLDKIYQTAHYLLTQRSGGWPLTVFLTPDTLAPFFSGTYFPPQARYRLPAFKDVLQAIADLYQHKMADIQIQNSQLLQALTPQSADIIDQRLNSQPLQHAQQVLQRAFDPVNGGFNGAPKFPQAPKLEFLLRIESPIAPFTLQHIAAGGIYDQIAGGFYRYSVDDHWRIPHFEKMLYDNAQLLFLYAQAAQYYADPAFTAVTHDTAHWIINSMQAKDGGYYSSLDADSEGHEGKYYVWDKEEVKALLNQQEFDLINVHFGLEHPANFENHWHFYVAMPLGLAANELQIHPAKAQELLNSAKEKLLTTRAKRIPPGLDDKILTSWNALMIKAMLTAGTIFNKAEYIDSALRALTYIKKYHWHNSRLLAVSKQSKAHLPAYLDDYAYLIDALLTSLQSSWDSDHLDFAVKLADILLKHFYDTQSGGFYFTADDHEKLLYRPKSMTDEAIPAGNGIAARALFILGHLLGNTRYISAAETTLQSAWPMLAHYPAEHPNLLLALQDYLEPPQLIILRGNKHDMMKWRDACKSPRNYIFMVADDVVNLPEAIADKSARGRTCAYVCQGMVCRNVIEDIDELRKAIHE